jgi:hypothetical protein
MSISVNGISRHMISYYKMDDVRQKVLARPLQDPRLQRISVRPELYLKQGFRAPIEETEHCDMDRQTYPPSSDVLDDGRRSNYDTWVLIPIRTVTQNVRSNDS